MTVHHDYSEGKRPEGEMDKLAIEIMASLSISAKQALPWSGMERDARKGGVPFDSLTTFFGILATKGLS